ncbi:MAG: cyclic nucleotide-binding domain-containing protein [Planctomycetes bacterium]|nr:cyclic nucleotide-binding domain-containing protein [Planctomycetota bacterium]
MASSGAAKPLSDLQIARLARGVLDIPPRTRGVMIVAGLAGLVLVFMESLVGRQAETIRLDKILHFSGYALLGLVFVLGLRPRLFVPGLVGLVAMGVVVEFLQRETGRTFDLRDGLANALGVAIGGALGLLVRALHAYVRKELALAAARRRLVSHPAGAVVLRQGDPIDHFYVVRQGELEAVRTEDGKEVLRTTAGAREVVGLLGLVRGERQYATVRARTPVQLYRMTLDELLDTAGGRDQPVALVTHALVKKLREAADRIVESGVG